MCVHVCACCSYNDETLGVQPMRNSWPVPMRGLIDLLLGVSVIRLLVIRRHMAQEILCSHACHMTSVQFSILAFTLYMVAWSEVVRADPRQ